MKNFSTYSRNNLAIPQSEIRLNAKSISKTPWSLFCETNRDILRCYQICVTKILSNVLGTTFENISAILRYEYLISEETVLKFLRFISFNETKNIEFEEPMMNIHVPIIFLKPRMKVSIVGDYSPYVIPTHSNTNNNTYEEFE